MDSTDWGNSETKSRNLYMMYLTHFNAIYTNDELVIWRAWCDTKHNMVLKWLHDDVIKWKHFPHYWPFGAWPLAWWAHGLIWWTRTATNNVVHGLVTYFVSLYWLFEIKFIIITDFHGSLLNSPYKGQWRGVLVFSLIYAWINGWVNNREAGDFRRHRPHYDVTVMRWGRSKFARID